MNLKNKKFLMYGKPRAFTQDEFDAQIRFQKIEILSSYEDNVEAIIEGKMMTPYEQNSSDALYERLREQNKTTPFIDIDKFEQELAKQIDSDTLLMSLKLSHDKERLIGFIKNSTIPDTLFFKLLKMYNWNGEDFFENDANRDVSAAFIARFYKNIERNHNVQYATTGFIHLSVQTEQSQLLEEIFHLQPTKLHPKLLRAIAMSPALDESLQKRLYALKDEMILEALSRNPNLSQTRVEAFLEEGVFVQNIARYIHLDDELFTTLQGYKKDLALNETLTLPMQKELLNDADEEMKNTLASNQALHQEMVEILLEDADENIEELLVANKATNVETLRAFYQKQKHLLSLAKNPSTPIDILYQLQLDSRYERAVKTNKAFGEHIQSENIGWLV